MRLALKAAKHANQLMFVKSVKVAGQLMCKPKPAKKIVCSFVNNVTKMTIELVLHALEDTF